MNVKLIWSTPDAEKLLGYIARVSNPKNQENPDVTKLIRYMIDHKHWSPFEMVDACVEVECTRDIGRQILRHKSFSFQEFSQRYSEVPGFEYSECRLQDEKNRQSSLETEDQKVIDAWNMAQAFVIGTAEEVYKQALKLGIAKEIARKVLPEGLTVTRMYMKGNLRSWIHYLGVRLDKTTQKEHREIAKKIYEILTSVFPITMGIVC